MRAGNIASVVTAIVLLSCELPRVVSVAEELVEVEGVAEVYSVAGDYDLVAMVRVARHEELADVVTRRMAAIPGIVSTQTLIAFQAYSKADLERLWNIGAE